MMRIEMRTFSRVLRRVAPGASALVLLAGAASAQVAVPLTGEVIVSPGLNQLTPAITATDDGVAVAWAESADGVAPSRIRVAALDDSLVLAGAPLVVSDGSLGSGDDLWPAVAPLGAGDLFVAWQGRPSTGSIARYNAGRRLSSGGLGPLRRLDLDLGGATAESRPTLVPVDGGEVLVGWQLGACGSTPSGELCSLALDQRIGTTGGLVGGPRILNFQLWLKGGVIFAEPEMIARAGGALLVTTGPFQLGESSVMARAVGADGRPDGPARYLLNNTGTDFALERQASALPDGSALVVWKRDLDDGSFDEVVEARRVAADGAPVGAVFAVDPDGAEVQLEPRVLGLADGRWLVLWREASVVGATARLVDASGALVGSPFALPVHPTDLVALPDGGFVTVAVVEAPNPQVAVQRFRIDD